MTKIVESIGEARNLIRTWKCEGLSVGLVPTMGYLHQGHQSLIQKATHQNDRVVVSVFVNQMQFAPGEDLDTYPRDEARDLRACEQAGANLLFRPSTNEMYAANNVTNIHVNQLSEGLCGKSRPTHFDGVCLVVAKLFNIIEPNRAYFGQKDAQQLLIVRRMVRDLNFDIQVIGCPIIRERDGLAKSSRNSYLSLKERKAAGVLHRALCCGRNLCEDGQRDTEQICAAISEIIASEPLAQLEYCQVVSPNTMQPVKRINEEVLCALAVRIGSTRLIDNFFYTPKDSYAAYHA